MMVTNVAAGTIMQVSNVGECRSENLGENLGVTRTAAGR